MTGAIADPTVFPRTGSGVCHLTFPVPDTDTAQACLAVGGGQLGAAPGRAAAAPAGMAMPLASGTAALKAAAERIREMRGLMEHWTPCGPDWFLVRRLGPSRTAVPPGWAGREATTSGRNG